MHVLLPVVFQNYENTAIHNDKADSRAYLECTSKFVKISVHF